MNSQLSSILFGDTYEPQSKLLKGGLYRGLYRAIGLIKRDTRSLDYSSYRV